MPFPPTDRVIFRNNPLREVICQLRFPTILAIKAETTAAMQDRLREVYPLYRMSTPEFGADVPKELTEVIGRLVPEVSRPHFFETESKARLVSLNTDFLALTERDYKRWEMYLEEFRKVKAAFEEGYRPAFYNRIGLRYQDLIDREELGLKDERWDKLVNPVLAGVLSDPAVEGDVIETSSTSAFAISGVPEGRARVQYGLVSRDVDGASRKVFAIDSDFYSNGRFSLEGVENVLAIFSRTAGDLFRWAIQPGLREALQPEPVD